MLNTLLSQSIKKMVAAIAQFANADYGGDENNKGVIFEMDKEKNELDELTREISKIITDNTKFLDRVMDDNFEPEEDPEEESEITEEL